MTNADRESQLFPGATIRTSEVMDEQRPLNTAVKNC
jgi:hypothetical protein